MKGWEWIAERLINVERDTSMLLPPDLREWVAGNDLALLILDAVELCDLHGTSRNVRGTGSAQYPPWMMVGLDHLLRCVRDVQQPAHQAGDL